MRLAGFKRFFEAKDEKENHLDAIHRELGIDPNSIPEFIESGPIEIEGEGLWFNQAVWQVIKPIELSDEFVKIKFHKSLSPDLNQICLRRRQDGKMEPAQEDLTGKVFLIPLKKLAEILGQGFQQPQSPGGMV